MIGDLTPDINTSPWFTKIMPWLNLKMVLTFLNPYWTKNINSTHDYYYYFSSITKICSLKYDRRNLPYITICKLWYMYTKMKNYRHFKSAHKISLFSSPRSEGIGRHRAFVGRLGRFVSLGFFLCRLVFLYFCGYKQFYTLYHAKC